MKERRSQPRFHDAELVMVSWQEGSTIFKQLGNVEDISRDGAGIVLDYELPVGSSVTISYGEGELAGIVRYYAYRADGHFIGIEFLGDSKESTLHFQPELLLRGELSVNLRSQVGFGSGEELRQQKLRGA